MGGTPPVRVMEGFVTGPALEAPVKNGALFACVSVMNPPPVAVAVTEIALLTLPVTVAGALMV